MQASEIRQRWAPLPEGAAEPTQHERLAALQKALRWRTTGEQEPGSIALRLSDLTAHREADPDKPFPDLPRQQSFCVRAAKLAVWAGGDEKLEAQAEEVERLFLVASGYLFEAMMRSGEEDLVAKTMSRAEAAFAAAEAQQEWVGRLAQEAASRPSNDLYRAALAQLAHYTRCPDMGGDPDRPFVDLAGVDVATLRNSYPVQPEDGVYRLDFEGENWMNLAALPPSARAALRHQIESPIPSELVITYDAGKRLSIQFSGLAQEMTGKEVAIRTQHLFHESPLGPYANQTEGSAVKSASKR